MPAAEIGTARGRLAGYGGRKAGSGARIKNTSDNGDGPGLTAANCPGYSQAPCGGGLGVAWLRSPPNSSNSLNFLEGSSFRSFRKVYRQTGDAIVNEMKWVPGFIWVTGFSISGREVDEKWPYLLAVSAIESVSELQDYQRTGLRCGCIALQTAEDTAGMRTVLETPEEIAERLRQEWEGRVSLQAEIRRAVESGEAE